MTFQPPPPPPGGNPPPPPPSGQWGPPPGQGGSPAKFDAKSVNPLDWGIVGAGALTFLFSFIAFYDGAEITDGSRSADVDSGTYSAWHDVIGGGFFSWFAMIFAVVGAAITLATIMGQPNRLPIAPRLAALGAFALATLFELIGIFVTPGDSTSNFGGSSLDVSLNHGIGFWISLLAVIAGTVLALMRLQQTGGQLPGALANVPNIGGYGPQGHGGPGAGGPGAGGPGAGGPGAGGYGGPPAGGQGGYGGPPPPQGPPQGPPPGGPGAPPPPGYGPPR